MKPEFINATKESYLQKLANAFRSLDGKIDECDFILFTTSVLMPGDDISKFYMETNARWNVEALFNGKKLGKIAGIRKKLCTHMNVTEDELKKILEHTKMYVGEVSIPQLKVRINRNLSALSFKPIQSEVASEPYLNIAEKYFGETMHLTPDIVREHIRINGLLKENAKSSVFVRQYKTAKIPTSIQQVCDLTEFFEDGDNARYLKKQYKWNIDIVNRLDEFVKREMNCETQYKINFKASLSIAYYLGYKTRPQFGLHACAVQSSEEKNEPDVWKYDENDKNTYSVGKLRHEKVSDAKDTALILNISNNITSHVKSYLKQNKTAIGDLYIYDADEIGLYALKNGMHAWKCIDYIRKKILEDSAMILPDDKRDVLHIFGATPAAFMFMFGHLVSQLGATLIYEYDMDGMRTKTYSPGIGLPVSKFAELE